MLKFRQIVFAIVATLTLLTSVSPVQAQDSLYDRLGGQAAIEAGAAEMVHNWQADERISRFFDLPPERVERLTRLLVEQICEATGGPCTYSGRTMKEAHMGLGLSDADFDAVIEGIVKALNSLNVPEQEQQELLPVLLSMRDDVTEDASPVTMPVTGGTYNHPLMGWILAALFGLISVASWFQRKRLQTES